VQSARFERIAEPPAWSPGFYLDEARSGGPLFDLHVHDVDFALWCFGEPQAVSASGTRRHWVADWRYPDAPALVGLEGGWVSVPGFGFRMRYLVVFEEAVAEFRHGERQPLRVTTGGGTRPVPLARESAYEAEVRHVLRAVRDGTELRATLADAERATRIIEQERAQLPA
jgi:predicted dehydrogenase